MAPDIAPGAQGLPDMSWPCEAAFIKQKALGWSSCWCRPLCDPDFSSPESPRRITVVLPLQSGTKTEMVPWHNGQSFSGSFVRKSRWSSGNKKPRDPDSPGQSSAHMMQLWVTSALLPTPGQRGNWRFPCYGGRVDSRGPHQSCSEESRARMMGPAGGRGDVAECWEPGCHLSERVFPGTGVKILALPLATL